MRYLRRSLIGALFVLACTEDSSGPSTASRDASKEVPVTAAKALRFKGYCTTGPIVACASVSVRLLRLANGQTSVVIRAKNLGKAHPSVNVGKSLLSGIFLDFPFDFDPIFSPNGDLIIDPSKAGQVGTPNLWDTILQNNGLTISGVSGGVGISGCDPAPAGTVYPNFGGPYQGAFVTCKKKNIPGPVIYTFTPDDPVDFWTIENVGVSWQIDTPIGGVSCFPEVNCFQVPATSQ